MAVRPVGRTLLSAMPFILTILPILLAFALAITNLRR